MNRGLETKNELSLVSKQERKTGRKGKGRRRRGRRRSKVKVWIFVWIHDFSMEIMDYSMILVQELLGYGLRGFHLDINLVPFFRVLLGILHNSRIKGSLVENP